MKRELLYFLGGAMIGGISAGAGTYIYTKKKFEKVVNDELAKIRKEHEKKVADIYDNNLVMKKPTQEEVKAEEEALCKSEEIVPITKVDYAAYSKEKDAIDENHNFEGEPNGDDACDEDLDDIQERGRARVYPVEDESKIPYVIDNDEIDSSYDIVSLTYYERDESLADDQTQELVQAADTVSNELLEQFVNSNEDSILICKESDSTVYEVTRYPGSYSEEVLGLPADEGGGKDGSYIDTE